VTSDAEPWIPTLAQLRELAREVATRDDDQPQPHQQRQVLNEPPRSRYDRVMPEITATAMKEPAL